MDTRTFKERVLRLKEIGKVLEALPSEIRALAFPILSDYAATGAIHEGDTGHGGKPNTPTDTKTPPSVDRESFFKKFDQKKPSDNARLLAAWHYREYGTETFSVEEIKDLATEVGITIPERIDMTYSGAAEDGKKLFTHAGRGKFKPTVYGEAYLKETYKIIKGTKQRPVKAK